MRVEFEMKLLRPVCYSFIISGVEPLASATTVLEVEQPVLVRRTPALTKNI